MKTEPPAPASDALAQLLAKAGPRSVPPARVEVEVRAAVHAEWLHLMQQKRARRQRWLAVAALLVMVVAGGWLARTVQQTAPDSVTVASLIGSIEYAQGEFTLNDRSLQGAAVIHAGDRLDTHSHGGMRLKLSNGMHMRVAARSSLHWLDAQHVEVKGRVYVDSHDNAAPLILHTTLGSVTHLGTHYFVDADGQSLRVAVRLGQAGIDGADARVTVNAMEQLQLRADRQIVREQLQLDDPSWSWAAALSEPFALENRSVADLLQWVAEETGYQLHYASREVSVAAHQTVLHGQQISQASLRSLQTVLAATDFHVTPQGQALQITQAP